LHDVDDFGLQPIAINISCLRPYLEELSMNNTQRDPEGDSKKSLVVNLGEKV
jgi:hypothetical protein